MGPLQPASEIFLIVAKEAQGVIRLPNDHVKINPKTSNLPTRQSALKGFGKRICVTAGYQRTVLKGKQKTGARSAWEGLKLKSGEKTVRNIYIYIYIYA